MTPVIHSFAHGGRIFRLTRIRVEISEGNLYKAVDAVEQGLLIPSTSIIYQRGGELVRIVHRADGSDVIEPVSPAWLSLELGRHFEFGHWTRDRQTKERIWKRCDPPQKLVDSLISKGSWPFPELLGIAPGPTLDRNGQIVEKPGYDATTKMYVVDHGCPSVPPSPTKDDATHALSKLRDVFKDMPFADPHDESVALSGVLHAAIRPSLPTAPMIAVSAIAAGSGKSLMVDAIAIIVTTHDATTVSYVGNNSDEDKKAALSLMRMGAPLICIDNVEQTFASDTWCILLTQAQYTGRLLGQSRMIQVPTCSAVFATGNNITIAGDLTRRTLKCDLNPRCEKPHEREFDRDLRDYCRTNRAQLLIAALTILRAHHLAGRPTCGVTPYGSFTEWSGWVRASLIWLGMPDPLLSLNDYETLDPEKRTLRSVLLEWWACFGGTPKTVHEVLQGYSAADASLHLALLEAVGDRSDKIDCRKLAHWLSRNCGRIVDGFCFERAGMTRTKTILWTVVPVQV